MGRLPAPALFWRKEKKRTAAGEQAFTDPDTRDESLPSPPVSLTCCSQSWVFSGLGHQAEHPEGVPGDERRGRGHVPNQGLANRGPISSCLHTDFGRAALRGLEPGLDFSGSSFFISK